MKRTLFTTLGLVLLFASFTYAQQPAPTAPTTPAQSQTQVGPNFVDADGDGICDNQASRAGQKRGRGYGPGDGTGNKGVGPRDGNGYGAAARGAGRCPNCTGTGPQGQGYGRRGRG